MIRQLLFSQWCKELFFSGIFPWRSAYCSCLLCPRYDKLHSSVISDRSLSQSCQLESILAVGILFLCLGLPTICILALHQPNRSRVELLTLSSCHRAVPESNTYTCATKQDINNRTILSSTIHKDSVQFIEWWLSRIATPLLAAYSQVYGRFGLKIIAGSYMVDWCGTNFLPYQFCMTLTFTVLLTYTNP